jgi:hypothetical protein
LLPSWAQGAGSAAMRRAVVVRPHRALRRGASTPACVWEEYAEEGCAEACGCGRHVRSLASWRSSEPSRPARFREGGRRAAVSVVRSRRCRPQPTSAARLVRTCVVEALLDGHAPIGGDQGERAPDRGAVDPSARRADIGTRPRKAFGSADAVPPVSRRNVVSGPGSDSRLRAPLARRHSVPVRWCSTPSNRRIFISDRRPG